jgi:hypothetical protein
MGSLNSILNDINSVLIEGKTHNDVCKIITEELGINDKVAEVSLDIMKEISKDISMQPKQYFTNIPGASFKDGLITYQAFGKKITVKYRYINYRDKSYFDKYDANIRQMPNDFNYATKTLRLTIKSISGNIDIYTFADTIQHELEHYFQETKINHSLADSNWYKIALKCKNRPRQSLTYMLGDIMYITTKCEEEAFTNGLYAALVYNYKNDNIPTYEILDNSPVYNALLTLRKEKEIILNNKDDISLNKTLSTIKKATGKDFNYIISKVEKGEKELVRRIGRVIVKAQKDCNIPNDMWINNRRNTYTKKTVEELNNA